ncbi:MAG: 50S ribosomal protein L17 [Bdellovibrio sp.]|nr:MAG: 50S ribosomal protein L17 [Bdellovibrio sp.]
MRHKVKTHSFGRRQGPRKALMRGLVSSLVEHGRIKTTVAKAKELRRHVERAITIGKAGDLSAIRVLLKKIPNKKTVRSLVNDIAPRFKERPGGYTRIIKAGNRTGDQAPMAYIEFVDYQPPAATTEETVKGDKELVKKKRQAARKAQKAKKHRRKMQEASRKKNRNK